MDNKELFALDDLFPAVSNEPAAANGSSVRKQIKEQSYSDGNLPANEKTSEKEISASMQKEPRASTKRKQADESHSAVTLPISEMPRGESSSQHDNSVARLKTLEEFLKLRCGGTFASRSQLQRYLEETFVMTLPLTPYRVYPESQAQGQQRVVVGIDAVVEDITSISNLIRSINLAAQCRDGKSAVIDFQLEQLDAMYSVDPIPSESFTKRARWTERCMCYWKASLEVPLCIPLTGQAPITQNARSYTTGMLRCTFDGRTGRLESLDLRFDALGVLRQLSAMTPTFCRVRVNAMATTQPAAPSTTAANEGQLVKSYEDRDLNAARVPFSGEQIGWGTGPAFAAPPASAPTEQATLPAGSLMSQLQGALIKDPSSKIHERQL